MFLSMVAEANKNVQFYYLSSGYLVGQEGQLICYCRENKVTPSTSFLPYPERLSEKGALKAQKIYFGLWFQESLPIETLFSMCSFVCFVLVHCHARQTRQKFAVAEVVQLLEDRKQEASELVSGVFKGLC